MAPKSFETWRQMLAGAAVSLAHADPQPGYYRFRVPADAPGPWQRGAIWFSEGELTGEINGSETIPMAVWERVVGDPHATTHEDYNFHYAEQHYPDEPPPGARNQPAPVAEAAFVEDEPHHKAVYRALGRDADLHFSIANTLLQKPLDQVNIDDVVDLTVKMLDTAKRAETQHDVEKEPFLTAGRQVDDRWSFSKTLREAARTLRDRIITPILAQRAAADKAKRDAEEKAAREAHAKALAATPVGAAPPPPPEPIAVTPIRVSAGSGKKTVALKAVDVAKVTDRKAFCGYLLDAEHADLLALLDKIAAQMLRSKVAKGVPGLTIESEEKAK